MRGLPLHIRLWKMDMSIYMSAVDRNRFLVPRLYVGPPVPPLETLSAYFVSFANRLNLFVRNDF